jgi:hypothetical protein
MKGARHQGFPIPKKLKNDGRFKEKRAMVQALYTLDFRILTELLLAIDFSARISCDELIVMTTKNGCKMVEMVVVHQSEKLPTVLERVMMNPVRMTGTYYLFHIIAIAFH